mmetsp:Transcript_902/g.1583  ORF Transcript_902/g.1583 Transcript_902/m.1583 type:complete len:203 (-) Transcript_902:238-846(-)
MPKGGGTGRWHRRLRHRPQRRVRAVQHQRDNALWDAVLCGYAVGAAVHVRAGLRHTHKVHNGQCVRTAACVHHRLRFLWRLLPHQRNILRGKGEGAGREGEAACAFGGRYAAHIPQPRISITVDCVDAGGRRYERARFDVSVLCAIRFDQRLPRRGTNACQPSGFHGPLHRVSIIGSGSCEHVLAVVGLQDWEVPRLAGLQL